MIRYINLIDQLTIWLFVILLPVIDKCNICFTGLTANTLALGILIIHALRILFKHNIYTGNKIDLFLGLVILWNIIRLLTSSFPVDSITIFHFICLILLYYWIHYHYKNIPLFSALFTSGIIQSIYKTAFWNTTKMETIDDPDMRYAFFDFYINAGGNATKVLQKTLNALQSEIVLTEDGAIGPKTIACLNSVDHKLLYNTFIEKRKEYYQNLVKAEPEYKRFLNGWLNRVNTFKLKTDSEKYNVNC